MKTRIEIETLIQLLEVYKDRNIKNIELLEKNKEEESNTYKMFLQHKAMCEIQIDILKWVLK